MLVSLDTLKTNLGITDASEDTVLTGVLTRSDALAKRIMGRTIEAVDYEEIVDGHGEQIIQLKNYPVITFTSIEYKDAWVETWTAFNPIDYSVNNETWEVRFPYYRVMRGFGNIRISYRAWYESDEIPGDIEDAVIQIATSSYNKKNSGGIVRERVDGAEIQYSQEQTPSEAESILLSYRSIHV